MKSRSYVLGFLGCVCMVLIGGCSTPSVEVGLSSTANLNMNQSSEPLPVVVRVYQLAQRQAFDSASFEAIWKDDLATLGDSLLTKEEIVMDPAYQRALEMPRHEQARFVGVIAIFRDPEPDRWRDIQELSSSWITRQFSNEVHVALRGSRLEID